MKKHDLIVIGAGPGGYVAAIRAAQLGLDVACIDEHKQLGGTCLRVGCIPSKALLDSSERFAEARNHLADHGVKVGEPELDLAAMLKRKDKIVTTLTGGIAALFKKNKITHYQGRGSFEDGNTIAVNTGGDDETVRLQAKHIVIATGSKPAPLPGVELDGRRIGTSTEALAYDDVPEHLVVIGAGYIGLEMGSVWARLGSKVTVLEYLDRILPGMDAGMAQEAFKLFKRQGLNFHLGCRVTGAKTEGDKCVVEGEGFEMVECDRVLLAVGCQPNTEGLGLDAAGVETDGKGFIKVDKHFATAAANIYAIGDVIGGAMLAHKAEDEGIACVEQIATGHSHVDYDAIPAVVYTSPEIASVGKTQEQLEEASIDFRKGEFFFRANGRAWTLGQTEGRVKILADAASDRVLGVHILGPRAGDMIAEAAAAIAFGASSEDIARLCHAHPTLSEALREAALAVDRRTIHS